MDVASIAQAAMMMQSAMIGQDMNILMLRQAAAQEQAALAMVAQAQKVQPSSASHLGANVDLTA